MDLNLADQMFRLKTMAIVVELFPWVLLFYLIFRFIKAPARWPHLLKFLPIEIFLWAARKGNYSDVAWQHAFTMAAACTLVTFAILIYKKIVFDRLMLGANLFFVTGFLGFSFNIEQLLHFLGAFKGASFIFGIVLVGLYTTFFTQAGFVGVIGHDKKKTRLASYQLLAVTIAAFVFSVVANSLGLFASAVLPFGILRLVREWLVKSQEV